MEDAFDTTTEDRVVALDDPQLRRVHQLEHDMDFFYGAQWRDVIQPSAATRTYVARVKEVAEKQPYLLVAHQYTRYLGDLFGGQMMGGMAVSSLGLEDNRATSFYRFRDIKDNKAFISQWYTE